MSGKPRKEKVIAELGKTHKMIIDRFVPWFGNTTGEVMVNLSLRWIEENIADVNLNTLEHLGAFTKFVPVCKRELFSDPARDYMGFSDNTRNELLNIGTSTPKKPIITHAKKTDVEKRAEPKKTRNARQL